MLKLIKYEFRKQLMSKVILIAILALMEIAFWIGNLTKNEPLTISTVALFMFLSVASVLFISYESIFTYSNDLKTKHSYMLFMTPNSTYKIIGAKILTSMITIILTAIVFISVALLNFSILMLSGGDLSRIIDVMTEMINNTFNGDLGYIYIAFFCASMVFELISILVIGMTSITLSATFLANSKIKGLISVIFFFGLTYLLSKLQGLILPDRTIQSTQPYVYECIWSFGVVVIFYLLTSFMLDKKVSV